MQADFHPGIWISQAGRFFSLVSLFNDISTHGLFNTKAILVEGQ